MSVPNPPDCLSELYTALVKLWPQIYAWLTAVAVGLLRSLLNGKGFVQSLLEALLCGCLTLAVFPVLDYFGLSTSLAVAFGAALAFLGVDWFRQFLTHYLGRLSRHRRRHRD